MARTATELRDYSEGYVFRAPLGTALPTTAEGGFALIVTPGLWTEIGYVSPVKMTPKRDSNEIKGWAGRGALGAIQTDVGGEISFGALQSNATSAELWQGSSAGLSADVPMHYAWVVLALDGDDACVFTVTDGQAGQPAELDFGSEDGLQWGVTIRCFEDANGMFWRGPYFDAAVS